VNSSNAASIKHRILCVDDEIVGTRMRGEILKELGYSVVLYHCPLAALRCDLNKFDLAVLDFQMPGLNGWELFLRMRALGARFPAVLLTGCLDALSYEERILFTRCLDKGTPIQRLLETLAECLNTNQVPDCDVRGQL
jgi:CheY-like chemotaxis protein